MSTSTLERAGVVNPAGSNDDFMELAEDVKRELQLCQKDSTSFLEHAIRAGELLNEAKGAVGHGKVYKWLEENCDVSKRQAQRYMTLAKHRDRFEGPNATRASHLTQRGALGMLTRGLNGADEDSSEEKESQEDLNAAYEAELAEHKRRSKELRRLQSGKTPTKTGPVLKRTVEKGIGEFTDEIVKVARKHGKRLCTKEVREVGVDPEFVAMLLVTDAKDRLDPYKDFAPARKIAEEAAP